MDTVIKMNFLIHFRKSDILFLIAEIFIFGHMLSWKVGGLKHWIARQNSIVWSIIIGITLRPTETVDFIYFRF